MKTISEFTWESLGLSKRTLSNVGNHDPRRLFIQLYTHGCLGLSRKAGQEVGEALVREGFLPEFSVRGDFDFLCNVLEKGPVEIYLEYGFCSASNPSRGIMNLYNSIFLLRVFSEDMLYYFKAEGDELLEILRDLLNDDRKFLIIQKHYGIGVASSDLKQIGNELGMSFEEVQRLEVLAFRKILRRPRYRNILLDWYLKKPEFRELMNKKYVEMSRESTVPREMYQHLLFLREKMNAGSGNVYDRH